MPAKILRRRKIDNYGRQRQLGRLGDRAEGKDGCKSHNQIQPEGNSHLRHWLQQLIIKFNSFLEYLGNSEHSIKEYDWFVFDRFSQSRHTWENLRNRKNFIARLEITLDGQSCASWSLITQFFHFVLNPGSVGFTHNLVCLHNDPRSVPQKSWGWAAVRNTVMSKICIGKIASLLGLNSNLFWIWIFAKGGWKMHVKYSLVLI